ncbi:MAG TPA: hypothetical protein DCX60_07655, partial [Phycisphaerales bacterium]|nr:hypothetical protein [Phycisphaerales bacterium]
SFICFIGIMSAPCTATVQSDDERIDELLNHANTMYWAGRARPYSSVEPQQARVYLEEAVRLLGMETDSPETSQRLRRARRGLEQSALALDERSEQLGSWSPWYGVLLGKDEVIEWFDNPAEIAAQRAVDGILGTGSRLPFVTDQVFVYIDGEDVDPAVIEVAHAYLNANTKWYAISPHEVSSALSAEELLGISQSPPEPSAMQRLIDGMSSDEIAIENLGVLRLVVNDEADGVLYLGAYYRHWKDGLDSEREWYSDGFAQGPGYPLSAPYLLLILGGLLMPLVARILRGPMGDPSRRLVHVPHPPFWSGFAAIIAGYTFAMLGRQGLMAANPDLLHLHVTMPSIAWITGISIVLLVLPMMLVYVIASRLNGIATRLANHDMIFVLLFGSWFGAQVLVLEYGAAITGFGETAGMLALPMFLGGVSLAVFSNALVTYDQTGERWSLASCIAVPVGLCVASIIEMRGTWPSSITAGVVTIAPVIVVLLAQRVKSGSPVAESKLEADEGSAFLREPNFIETTGIKGLLDALEEHVTGDSADDEAIEVVWLDGIRGCGKTRLVKELGDRIKQRLEADGRADEVLVLFGDCNEPGDPEADIPYEPLRQAFSELMGVHRFGNPAENARRLQQGLEKVAASASVAGSAISVALNVAGGDEEEFTTANEGMIAEEMVEVLVHSTSPTESHPMGRRISIILDDVQWIDEESLRLLRALLERLVDRFVAEDETYRNRVSLLITRRTDVDEETNKRGEEVRAVFSSLQDRKVVNLMGDGSLEDTVGSAADSEEWRERIFDQLGCTERARRTLTRSMESHGLELPLHRLEYLKLAFDGGYLRTVDGRCDLVTGMRFEELDPGSEFEAMVRRELEGLDQRLVEVLHCCAIIGRSFQVSLVARIFELDVIDLISMLGQAEQRGIVVDCLEADDIYEFRDKRIAGAFRSANFSDSGRVQQMVREYHLRFVQVRNAEIRDRFSDPSRIPFNDVMTMAYHSAIVSERIPGETIRWARLAAQQCEQRRLYGRAVERLLPAVNLVRGRTDLAVALEDRMDILLHHAELVLKVDGDSQTALESLDQVEREVGRMPEGARENVSARHALTSATLAYRSRRFSEVDGIVDALINNPSATAWMRLRGLFLAAISMDPREQAGDKHERLEALYVEVTEKQRAADDASDHESVHQYRLLASELLNALGGSRLYFKADPESAREAFEAALKINREPGITDRKGEAIAQGGLGDVWAAIARNTEQIDERAEHLRKANYAYDQNLTISRETGDQAGVMRMTSMLGGLELDAAAASNDKELQEPHFARARRLYEESTMLAVENRRSFAFRFGFIGLIRIEDLAGTPGTILLSILEEARNIDLLDDDTSAAILEALEGASNDGPFADTRSRLKAFLV